MNINVKSYMRFLALIIMGRIFLPVIFEHINLPIIGYYGLFFVWFLSLSVFAPHILVHKCMIPIYIYILVYSIMSLLGYYILNKSWLMSFLLPVFFSVSMLWYFLENDYIGLSYIAKFSLGCVIITSITSIYGLIKYPNATRLMIAGASAGEFSMFSKMGIGNYGFFSGLSYTLPILIGIERLYLKNNLQKTIGIISIILCFIAIFRAAIAGPVLISLIAIILSWSGSKNIVRTRILFLLILLFYISIPTVIKSKIFYQLSYIAPNTELQLRLKDIGLAIESGVNVQNPTTTVEGRLERVPMGFEAIAESPIVGNKDTQGEVAHLYWLYSWAIFGIIGFIPLIYVVYYEVRIIYKRMDKSFSFYYILSVFLYILLGFLKNMTGKEMMFLIYFVIPSSGFLIIKNK